MTFYCLSVALAPAWSNTVNYTFGMVVNGGGSPPSAYIAVASSGVQLPYSSLLMPLIGLFIMDCQPSVSYPLLMPVPDERQILPII